MKLILTICIYISLTNYAFAYTPTDSEVYASNYIFTKKVLKSIHWSYDLRASTNIGDMVSIPWDMYIKSIEARAMAHTDRIYDYDFAKVYQLTFETPIESCYQNRPTGWNYGPISERTLTVRCVARAMHLSIK